MKKIKEKATLAAMKLRLSLMSPQEDTEGMEIIQVLILLAIGLGLIALFIGFGESITSAVTEKVNNFLSNF